MSLLWFDWHCARVQKGNIAMVIVVIICILIGTGSIMIFHFLWLLLLPLPLVHHKIPPEQWWVDFVIEHWPNNLGPIHCGGHFGPEGVVLVVIVVASGGLIAFSVVVYVDSFIHSSKHTSRLVGRMSRRILESLGKAQKEAKGNN